MKMKKMKKRVKKIRKKKTFMKTLHLEKQMTKTINKMQMNSLYQIFLKRVGTIVKMEYIHYLGIIKRALSILMSFMIRIQMIEMCQEVSYLSRKGSKNYLQIIGNLKNNITHQLTNTNILPVSIIFGNYI